MTTRVAALFAAILSASLLLAGCAEGTKPLEEAMKPLDAALKSLAASQDATKAPEAPPAPARFETVSLGWVGSDNYARAVAQLRSHEDQVRATMAFSAVAPEAFEKRITDTLAARFKSAVKLDSAADAAARGANLLATVDTTVAIGSVSFTSSTVNVTVTFADLAGRPVATATASGTAMVPWPNFSNRFDVALDEAMDKLGNSVGLSQELASAARTVPPAAPVAQAPPPPAKAAARATAAAPPPPPTPAPSVAPPVWAPRFPTTPVVSRFSRGGERPDDVAVIIGNADYSKQGKDIPDVKPAYADAEGMRLYATQALGIRDGNVIFLKDATGAQMIRVFGSKDDYRGQLYDWVKPGRSRVFVYYSGHGAPGRDGGSPYLVPSDADAGRIELSGYPVRTLYDNLGKLPADSVTVVLEACFSGVSQSGSVLGQASPVYFDVKPPDVPPKLTVVTAGSANQVASWEQDGSSGLFTKYFLLGMNGKASSFGRPSLEDMDRYLKETVTYFARRYYGRDQNVQILKGSSR